VVLGGAALPDEQKLTGSITRILNRVGPKTLFSRDPSETRGGEVLSFLISVDPPDADDQEAKHTHKILRPGLRLNVDIQFESKANVLFIPESYITREGGKFMVYRVENAGGDDKKANYAPVEVELGFKDGHSVEVVSGLQEGDKITQSPKLSLYENP